MAPPSSSSFGPADSAAPAASTRRLLGRLVGDHVRRYTPRLALALVFMALAAGATATLAKLIEPVLDLVFTNHDRAMLREVALVVLVVFAIKGLAAYGEAVVMNGVGQRIVADLQAALFDRLIHADLAFFNDTPTGALISHFTNDANLLRGAVSSTLTGIGKDALTLVFLVGVMFYQDWLLALIAFFAFPTAFLPIARLGRRMRRVSTDVQLELGRFTTLLDQVFQGARHVKAYGMERYETTRAHELIERLYRLAFKAGKVRAASSPIMETLGGIAIVAVIVYGGAQVISGARTTGTFFSFITALLLAYEPVKRLANLNTSLQEGLAAAQRLFASLDVEPRIRDAADARPLVVTRGEVRFERVSFAYRPGGAALDAVSLTVPAGKTAALVGPSGAGKSTILNLIARFYDVGAGRVLIDGQDVRGATLASLRGSVGLVAQEVGLFDDTVRANIAYGRLDATDAEIVAAARAAAAHDFIMALPEGYATPVGELGVKLSGGQRQRLAIARAMLKDAPILLLDEATSALDTESERQIQAALNQLMRGRTVLVIAHRLSTVIDADIIYVIEAGRVVEQGSHAELLARGGAYARLYALQFSDQVRIGIAEAV
ncbi:MAG TPA: ABC transporter ATP-binding protein [Candidatus Sulfotelmatobacter sp.]|nr:ABC transporter ATP-binding protein [Candidatus Sulfotelmatobacter sp.]